ncbi:MAG: nitrile hydratase subunit beta [Candidatus Tectomicrobia bacterium]|uniref:Nitrile hydratase subunit beta n=1 Tax=Tectimicrobiota bacterium TaxID=2528274 RepID=A0A937W3B9_UNCTE|nr:nitrile hydratase subunit beta [Candidatus Tectomicrobia bacterium]
MNGIHDMGGMHGFGPIVREMDEPLFHQDWERRVFAIRQVTPVPIPGGSRNNIEQMDPATYLTTSYYEKWLHSAIKGMLDAGVITETELAAKIAQYQATPTAAVARHEDPHLVEQARARIRRPLKSPSRDLPLQPQFPVGSLVRVRNLHPPGHTRLPRYVRGKPGQVTRYYGIYDFQDAMPAGAAAPPQPLYAVRFDGQVLWGPAAEANSVVYLDMWESYLEPA